MHIPEDKESKAVEGTEYVLMDNEPRLHTSSHVARDLRRCERVNVVFI